MVKEGKKTTTGLLATIFGSALAIIGGPFLTPVGAMIASWGLGLLLMKSPKTPQLTGDLGESPTYGFPGIKTTATSKAVVPVCYGVHRVGGNVIAEHLKQKGVNQQQNLVLALSEGPISIVLQTNTYINDRLYNTYDNCNLYTRLGTSDQSTIGICRELNEIQEVDLTFFEGGDPSGNSGSTVQFTTSRSCEEVKLTFYAPQGNYTIDTEDGDRSPTNAIFDYWYRRSPDGAWTQDMATKKVIRSQTDTITSDDLFETGNPFFVGFTVSQGSYVSGSIEAEDIPITPNSPDDTPQDLPNGVDSRSQGSLRIRIFETDPANGRIELLSLGTPESLQITYNYIYSYQEASPIQINYQSTNATRYLYNLTLPDEDIWDIKVSFRGCNKIDNSDYEIRTFSAIERAYLIFSRAKLVYPYTALLGISIDAADEISNGIDNVTTVIKGREVYNLQSGTTEFSRNPAYCIADLLTNDRYGLGISLDDIDTTSFVAAATYCDESVSIPGGTEERYCLDIVLDTSDEVLSHLRYMMNTCAGYLVWADGKIKLKLDKPTAKIQDFDTTNIIDNSFTFSYRASSDIKNMLRVSYLRETNLSYDQDELLLYDSQMLEGDIRKEAEVNLYGVTRPYQAMRLGNRMLNETNYCREFCSFQTGGHGLRCEAGDVINVAHPSPQWGYKKVQGVNMPLYYGITVSGDTRFYTKPHGMTQYYAWDYNTDYAVEPGDELGWIATSTISTEYGRWYKKVRVLQIDKDPSSTMTIQALEYDTRVYDDDVSIFTLDKGISPDPKLPPNAVREVGSTVYFKLLDSGDYDAISKLTWQPPVASPFSSWSYSHSKVYFRKYDDFISDYPDNYVYAGQGSSEFDHPDFVVGSTFEYLIRSVSTGGIEQPKASGKRVVVYHSGQGITPDSVDNFSVTLVEGYSISMSWGAVSSPDVIYYEIREGSDWDTGSLITRTTDLSYVIKDFKSGTHTYFICARNSLSDYSTIPGQDSISASLPSEAFLGRQTYYEFASLDGTTEGPTVIEYCEANSLGYFTKTLRKRTDTTHEELAGNTTYVGLEANGFEWDTPCESPMVTYTTAIKDMPEDRDLKFDIDESIIFSGVTPTREARAWSLDNGWSTWQELPISNLVGSSIQGRMYWSDCTTKIKDWDLLVDMYAVKKEELHLFQWVPSTGLNLIFDYDFINRPEVVTTTVGSTSGVIRIASHDEVGCTLYFYDLVGATVSGEANIYVRGII